MYLGFQYDGLCNNDALLSYASLLTWAVERVFCKACIDGIMGLVVCFNILRWKPWPNKGFPPIPRPRFHKLHNGGIIYVVGVCNLEKIIVDVDNVGNSLLIKPHYQPQ